MSNQQQFGLGYVPDLPDMRDFSTNDLPELYDKIKLESIVEELPIKYDFRDRMSPVRSQGSIGSCTAFSAVTGIVEYYNKNTYGDNTQLSPLFQYKMTRNLMGVTGDTGASIRASMKSLAVYGAVSEKDYPYIINKYDQEPDINLKLIGQNYQALKYARLDQRNMTTSAVLDEIKKHLVKNIPIIIGFSVFDSVWKQANNSRDGAFAFPSKTDKMIGGHAICLCSYDDNIKITNKQDGIVTTGGIGFKNSWGIGWGNKGYGILPYEYILKQVALDIWVLFSAEYTDLRVFN